MKRTASPDVSRLCTMRSRHINLCSLDDGRRPSSRRLRTRWLPSVKSSRVCRLRAYLRNEPLQAAVRIRAGCGHHSRQFRAGQDWFSDETYWFSDERILVR